MSMKVVIIIGGVICFLSVGNGRKREGRIAPQVEDGPELLKSAPGHGMALTLCSFAMGVIASRP
jgi:hypothetical protein